MLILSKHISSCVLRNALLIRSGPQLSNNVLPAITSLKTYAPLSAHLKTPIQKFGNDYLYKQKDMNRPLSPHLGIYQPQLTWYLSGAHRISGCVMGTAVGLMAIALLVTPFDFSQLIEYIRLLGLPTAFVYFVKFAIAWTLTFHSLNGIRFLGFDMAMGIDLASVYRSGWAVLVASIVLAIVFTFWRKTDKEVSLQK